MILFDVVFLEYIENHPEQFLQDVRDGKVSEESSIIDATEKNED